jgi:HEAT repeat protein
VRTAGWLLPILSLAVGCATAPPPADPGGDGTLRALEAVLREHGWPCAGVTRYEAAARNRFRAWCSDGNRYEILLTEEAARGAAHRETSLYPLFEVSREVELLRGADAAQRRAAAERLRQLGAEARAAVPHLVAALADPDASVRAAAASALGAIGPADDAARRALAGAADDPDPEVRASARAALAEPARD